ncbi:unnamed protein product, partial [marine sediment metagenome]
MTKTDLVTTDIKTDPAATDIQVHRFIVEGFSNADILEYLDKNGITIEDAKRSFENALNKFIKASKMPKSVMHGWCLEAYRDLYRRLLETGDYTGALRAVKEISSLADVMPKPKKVGKEKTDTKEKKKDMDNYYDSIGLKGE